MVSIQEGSASGDQTQQSGVRGGDTDNKLGQTGASVFNQTDGSGFVNDQTPHGDDAKKDTFTGYQEVQEQEGEGEGENEVQDTK